jgi:outer membrane protein assembly factor BamA
MKPVWHLLAFILLTALLRPSQLVAESEKPAAETLPASLVVLPVIYYTPETRLAFGVGGIYTFRPKGSLPADLPSYFQALAVYTQNKQFTLSLEPRLCLHGHSLLLTGLLELTKFPNKFWGIGPDTLASAEEDFTPAKQALQVTLQKRIIRRANLYVGLVYNFEHDKFLKFDPEGQLASGDVIGGKGGVLSGLGVIFSLDSRDNIFCPSRGDYFQVTSTFFSRILASEYDFSKFKADLRHYLPLGKSQVLALQCVFQAVPGTTPFVALSLLGGDSLMRGYYTGRYRDKVLLAGQAECRLPLWWRFGLVGFAGLGGVADRIGRLTAGGLKYSYGFGLRFKLNREGAKLRLDFGYGKGTSGIYFTAGQAF